METPTRPEVDDEIRRILDERLKTADEDAKSARPWREVLADAKRNLKQPIPR